METPSGILLSPRPKKMFWEKLGPKGENFKGANYFPERERLKIVFFFFYFFEGPPKNKKNGFFLKKKALLSPTPDNFFTFKTLETVKTGKPPDPNRVWENKAGKC